MNKELIECEKELEMLKQLYDECMDEYSAEIKKDIDRMTLKRAYLRSYKLNNEYDKPKEGYVWERRWSVE
jgi:hypothetical protein